VTERESADLITVHAWHLPATESLPPATKKAVSMPGIQKFDLREWLVAPILVPVFIGLMVAGAVIVQW
jgi:hypothetical protein